MFTPIEFWLAHDTMYKFSNDKKIESYNSYLKIAIKCLRRCWDRSKLNKFENLKERPRCRLLQDAREERQEMRLQSKEPDHAGQHWPY